MVKTIKQTLLSLGLFQPSEEDLKAFSAMVKEIEKYNGRLSFEIEISEEGWTAVCQEFPQIVTGGEKVSGQIIDAQIKDAIFSAFMIPDYMANKKIILSDSEVMRNIKSSKGVPSVSTAHFCTA